MQTSQLILIHETCHAGCLHCPYGANKERAPLRLEEIIHILRNSSSNLTIISGGEPLEYPFFSLLLDYLQKTSKPFRIATGGHIDISLFLDQLKNMPHFMGFSLGTDILIPERNKKMELKIQWLNNFNLLKETNTQYSLTITLGLDYYLIDLLKNLSSFKANPNFLMMSEREGEPYTEQHRQEQLLLIQKFFPMKTITLGYKN